MRKLIYVYLCVIKYTMQLRSTYIHSRERLDDFNGSFRNIFN